MIESGHRNLSQKCAHVFGMRAKPAAIFVEIFQTDGAVFAAFAARLLDVAAAGFGQHAFTHARSADIFVAALKKRTKDGHKAH